MVSRANGGDGAYGGAGVLCLRRTIFGVSKRSNYDHENTASATAATQPLKMIQPLNFDFIAKPSLKGTRYAGLT
jgi:hypothetical protein